jgi:hypothetical protein
MNAYEVTVTLGQTSVEVALPTTQSVEVAFPNRGPKGETGDVGPTGATGDTGATGAAGADGREVELQTTSTHVQWRYVGESEWNDLVALATITGPQGVQGEVGETGATGAAGIDGREVELQKTSTHVQWRYVGESGWNDLIPLADITGPQGETGETGATGPANTLTIGTVTTGAAGSSADATITGDAPNQTLSLTIPTGDTGATGPQGPAGPQTTDAADLTTGTLADARLSANVPLKDASNTFTQNQTLDGTNNVAPNQTAASGSSIMTRDLVTAYIEHLRPRVRPINFFGNGAGASGATNSINGNSVGQQLPATPAASNAAYVNVGLPILSDSLSNSLAGVAGTGPRQDLHTSHILRAAWRAGRSTIDDVLIDFQLGSSALGGTGQLGCVQGYGIRISYKDASTWNVALVWAKRASGSSPSITAASNASPIQLTLNGHGLTTGDKVEVRHVGGNTAANGIWTITRIDSNNVTLDGSTGNAAYTSGGSMHCITDFYELPALQVVRFLVAANRSVVGDLALHLESLTTTPILTASGMGATVNGVLSCAAGMQNVTATTGFFVSNWAEMELIY